MITWEDTLSETIMMEDQKCGTIPLLETIGFFRVLASHVALLVPAETRPAAWLALAVISPAELTEIDGVAWVTMGIEREIQKSGLGQRPAARYQCR